MPKLYASNDLGSYLRCGMYQGDEIKHTDTPTHLEAKPKPFFYAFRPLVTYPKKPTTLEFVNTVIQLIFDVIVVYFFGGQVLCYLIFGFLWATVCTPVVENTSFSSTVSKKRYETNSYYGPLNWITFNVGYHNEHHDFPYVPGSRLPDVKKIAPEFYDNLPQHNSWTAVLYDFVMNSTWVLTPE
ncbi:hypothetical protein MTP99_017217 [Tenebrio molitor]|nr:hypothetical protein MTP99_017217 [Tenebrio molitor]